MKVKFDANKQKEFFNFILLESSRKDLAKELSVSERRVKDWSNGYHLISKDIYEKLSITYGINYSKHVNFLPDNWGQSLGGKTTVSKIENIQEHMKNVYKNRRSLFGRVQHIKNIKAVHPLSLEVKKLDLDALPLIATMLLTDGHVYKRGKMYEIGFSSKSTVLSDLFLELVYLWSDKFTFSRYKDKNGVLRNYAYLPEDNDIVKITPSYKTSPHRQTKIQYFNEKQPSLDFLLKQDRVYKILCSRIALSTDGCLSIHFNRRKNRTRISGKLMLSCAHPFLCQEWKRVFSDIGLNFQAVADKNKWGGLVGLYCYKKTDIEKFYKYGGFIEGVAISGKSRYFNGKEKNELLRRYLETQEAVYLWARKERICSRDAQCG